MEVLEQRVSAMPAGIAVASRVALARRWAGLPRVAAFFALVSALVLLLHSLIQSGLREIATSGFGVTNRIVAGQINADVIITGSSRALVHYDPRIIGDTLGLTAFNLGRNGSQTDLQLAVLKTYLEHNKKPALVIHNLDLFSFTTTREIYDPAQYIPYLGEQAIYATVQRIHPHAWKWKYVPLYAYVVEDVRFTWALGLARLAGFSPAEDHIQGFVPRTTPWTGDFEKFKASNPRGVTFAIEPQGVRDLTELIELCHTAKIPLLLVYSPVYHEMCALEKNRAEVFSRFQSLADRFQTPLWDYSDASISRDRNNFYNSQHLNATGAREFSLALATRLRREFRAIAASPALRSGD